MTSAATKFISALDIYKIIVVSIFLGVTTAQIDLASM